MDMSEPYGYCPLVEHGTGGHLSIGDLGFSGLYLCNLDEIRYFAAE